MLALFLAFPAQAAFTDNADGTISDTVTGLMWDKCSWEQSNNTTCAGTAATTHTWAQALGVAVTANTASYKGHADWRLPNKNELESLVKIDASSPAIDTTAFPNTQSGSYWSSTNYAPVPARAWYVGFYGGYTSYYFNTDPFYVRLVRSGQSFGSFDSQADTTAPLFASATVNGSTLVMTYTEANTLDATNIPAASAFTVKVGGAAQASPTNVAVSAAGKTVTLTLAAAAVNGDVVTVGYADPSEGNNASAIQDAAGNDAATISDQVVTNNTAAVAYSATTFTEAAVNDGSISTSVTLTLSGDTYAGTVVSAGKITASAVPAGLAANFVLTSGTAITATLTGNATNHANANDIATLTFTFADGAFTATATAANVTNYAKNNLVVDFADPAPAPAPSAPSGGNDYTPPAPPATTLPTGGGTATLTGGQSVTVTENGKDGTSISLPPPITPTTPTTTGAPAASNSVNVTLPGTGTIGVSSGTIGTQLGVTKVTLPGATTAVNTVTVDQGSASFTASEKGQAVAGLKNGIVVVSGSKDSQVTVDATGPNTTIGVKSADTLIVPTGATGVAGTKVDLPPPTASGGQAATVNLNIGGHELTVQSSQANTTMIFEVVDIGGVQTPVLAVTGNAQVSSSGEDQPLVSVAGNVIKSGKSKGGGSSQVCNTIVQASSDASSDVVHVVTCYIVLEAGSFSAIGGGRGTGTGTGTGNNFAAIKDGIVWAGETAEFDKSGKVTSAYVGTRSGDTDAVGDDMVPGGGKFAASGYQVGAFIPRLNGTPRRLNGARLDESIFSVIKNALNVTVLPSTPSQSAQGVLNFNFAGDLINQGVQSANVTYTLSSDTASVLPSRRVRVDTSRADGVSISAEGEVDVAAGGLVTTFVASVPDPKAFADKLAQVLPGSTSVLRWNGSWQVKAADGTTYVGRPLWSFWAAAPGAETFSTLADGNILYSDNGVAQLLFPDFYDYDTLQGTFRTDLNDPSLTVLPRMDGTAIATVNGVAYIIAPQWNAFQPPAGKPAWWEENEVFYIKNFDGSAQGFTVK